MERERLRELLSGLAEDVKATADCAPGWCEEEVTEEYAELCYEWVDALEFVIQRLESICQ